MFKRENSALYFCLAIGSLSIVVALNACSPVATSLNKSTQRKDLPGLADPTPADVIVVKTRVFQSKDELKVPKEGAVPLALKEEWVKDFKKSGNVTVTWHEDFIPKYVLIYVVLDTDRPQVEASEFDMAVSTLASEKPVKWNVQISPATDEALSKSVREKIKDVTLYFFKEIPNSGS